VNFPGGLPLYFPAEHVGNSDNWSQSLNSRLRFAESKRRSDKLSLIIRSGEAETFSMENRLSSGRHWLFSIHDAYLIVWSLPLRRRDNTIDACLRPDASLLLRSFEASIVESAE